MITVITGLPGNGKTLFALWYIKKYAESENRPVYYSGIKDLQLPWTLIEPEKWLDLPERAIMVIDEAQFVFPKKPNGAVLPEFYSKLATHRHMGIDIFLITQHPSLLDPFVRKLIGRHYHAVRKFGMERSTIYEWSAVNDAPTSLASQKTAIPFRWSFPSEVYGWYKSAEAHTVKRSIPAKLILAVLFVIAVICFGFYMLKAYQRRAGVGVDSQPEVSTAVASGKASAQGGPASLDPMADAKAFVYMNTPRVKGMPHTAPKYDELTKPKRVPVPAMCVSSAKHCKCFTQQATPIDVEPDACRQFARDGFFQEFDPDGEASTAQHGATGESRQQQASTVSPIVEGASRPNASVSFSHDPAWYKAGPSAVGGGQSRTFGKAQ